MYSAELKIKQQKNRSRLDLLKKMQIYVGFVVLWGLGSYLIEHYVLHFQPSFSVYFSLNSGLFLVLGTIVLYLLLTRICDDHDEQLKQLQQSEETLLRVLNGSQLGFWDWHLSNNQVKRNATWAEILGYNFAEMQETTQQWSDFVHPHDREAAWASIDAVLKGETSEHQMMYRMKTKSGTYKWILDRARVVERDEQGNALRMSGTHTDVDTLKIT
jgi:PAS domain S-box-containing protein